MSHTMRPRRPLVCANIWNRLHLGRSLYRRQHTYPAIAPPPEQRDQTLTLCSGHTLGYAQFGHPNGYPLVFLHGFPSSRLEAWSLHEMLLRKHIRLIAPDRPGYGLSTPQPRRRMLDHASDVLQLMDKLKVERFAVLGGSGGGPYALACAREMSKERLKAVGLLAAMGSWTVRGAGKEVEQELMRDLRTSSWLLGRGMQVAPGMMKVLLDAWLGLARWLLAMPRQQKALDRWLADTGAKHAKAAGVEVCPGPTDDPCSAGTQAGLSDK